MDGGASGAMASNKEWPWMTLNSCCMARHIRILSGGVASVLHERSIDKMKPPGPQQFVRCGWLIKSQPKQLQLPSKEG